ncbi:MAG: carbohydrate ABC transporter permease [Candidatus Atribacteria bacterium]|nr:carbohydrate ABC transporter permease [Candidatus Atribacteria bacterium]
MKFSVPKVFIYIIIGFIFLFAFFPIFWTALSSFKYLKDIVTQVPKLLFTPTLESYRQLLHISDIRGGLINSLVVAPLSVLLGFVAGVPAAYIFARYPFKRRNDLQFWVISLRMMPPVAVVIPFIFIWFRLHLFDTYFSLIFTYFLISMPTIIWLSIESFRNVPKECEEAAMVEGCSYLQTFFKIAFPVAGPTLIGGVLFCFILVWNEFFMAFVLTSNKMTLPVAAGSFTMVGMEVPWGLICGSVCLLSIPPLVLTSIFRKFLSSYFLPSI